ncbi:transposase [Streptomyces sp. NPDC058548]|uniref:transposase n=1 Tax=unclassified Streptomyces TaxID=2593676 RepID=UPI0036541205
MGRGDLTDAEWERLRPFLPVSIGRCGRWRDHRQVIDGILHRVRTGVQWRDLPERFGLWNTVSRSTPPSSVRISTRPAPDQPAAGTRFKGAEQAEHQDETPWQSRVARLVVVVLEVRAWGAHGAGSPATST